MMDVISDSQYEDSTVYTETVEFYYHVHVHVIISSIEIQFGR